MTALGLRGVMPCRTQPHSRKPSSLLTSSYPHSRPALMPEVMVFSRTHPHSTAFNPHSWHFLQKKLSYRETAHLRVGTSLAFALLAPTLPKLSQKPRSSAAPEEFPPHILPRGEMPGLRGKRLTRLHISLAKEVILQEIAPLLSTLLWHRPRWNQTEAR